MSEINDKPGRLLSQANPGDKVVIVSIQGGRNLCQRLNAMGLMPRERIEVVHTGDPGPFVVKVKDSRVVLGTGMAEKIIIQ